MNLIAPHPWNLSPAEARALQEDMRDRVVARGGPRKPRRVCGIDVGFEEDGATARAAVVVLDAASLLPIDGAIVRAPTRFPYVPGLLSFRELPVVLAALACLEAEPDVLLCDAHGYAHPRRFGLACHLGVITDTPTIGVAKTVLVGRHEPLPAPRGSARALVHRGEVVGMALRTREAVQPVYVSVGHRIGLARAVAIVLACAPRYRLPETTRWAHRLASSPAGVAEALLATARKDGGRPATGPSPAGLRPRRRAV